ncbi:CLUMA_CG017226, isoform A [Clunio marinus]|uniref:CLUMA_CG017226, isoform A n=1 Tax=Clunio marinus TaxID=568069 RepID=A0A1J1IWP9_9DIPT|nr:CLUMA_CG017226, isoform A [Clunio marinus]
MNFPNVWEFKQKSSPTCLQKYSSDNSTAVKLLANVPMAKMVSITLPEVNITEIERIIKDSDYYSSNDFHISLIMNKNFIDGFLLNGDFSCLPEHLPEFDDYAYVSNNKLFIRLFKDNFCSCNNVEIQKYKIRCSGDFNYFQIDLQNPNLNISKLQDEVKNTLKSSKMVFMWSPFAENICSSSIAKYVSECGYHVKKCINNLLIQHEYGLTFPELIEDQHRMMEISEYAGILLLKCNIEDNDLSSYSLPDDCIDVGKGKTICCKGSISRYYIEKLINEVRKILKENSSFPYIIFSIISFSENLTKTLVITKNKIHNYELGIMKN